ncbi:hypothetical protein NA57DRAFT_70131 [Rhizodiscina lignyota]|uniref:SET domain-containing protein n=1 Tax=Rhizodiscina lignyota TaxID=1504668 RepID=A0A9P4IML9_9PEZI|nr:hypothetical protein NA57DRAFT_70131 [Rhizodiscina lignyota]
MARASSINSDGTSSTRSNINVRPLHLLESSPPPSDELLGASNTPPTSLDPTPSIASDPLKSSDAVPAPPILDQSTATSRSRRTVSLKVGAYNLKRLSGTDVHTPNKYLKTQSKTEAKAESKSESKAESKTASQPAPARTNGTVSLKGKLYATLDNWFSAQPRQSPADDAAESREDDADDEVPARPQQSARPSKRKRQGDERSIPDSEEERVKTSVTISLEEAVLMDVDNDNDTITVSPMRSVSNKQKAKLQEDEQKPPENTENRRASKRFKPAVTASASPSRKTRTSVHKVTTLSPSGASPAKPKEAETSGTNVRRTSGRLQEVVASSPKRSTRQTQKEIASAAKGKGKGRLEEVAAGKESEDSTNDALKPTSQQGAKSKFAKEMKTRGKFFSGESTDEVFPLPNSFFMGRFGPDEGTWTDLKQSRGFKLGVEVFNPQESSFVREGKDWAVTRGAKNVFAGDAKKTWNKNEYTKLPDSKCLCKPESGCDENCLNRIMEYECDDTNCPIGAAHCKNRPFYELSKRLEKAEAVNNRQKEQERVKAEAEKRRPKYAAMCMSFEQGVEVFETKGKGFGVRAQRSFASGQIIMEYFGEIIDAEERDHRMATVYKDSSDFYMMEFHNGFILDATKGSMCRFVNHSCEPNCEIRKMYVRNGTDKKSNMEPRMALFALEGGIRVGEELTYDYNFDPFSIRNAQKCLCGSAKCRGILGPRPPKERAKAEVVTKKATAVKQTKNGVIASRVEKKVKTTSLRRRS